ncbi:acyltransferase [Ferrimonas sediminicola]|uniref:Acyltransferase n=1 Tax=Ferrimonas sediminicola TaxID=2569538 RepID=A0A4U1BH15_9GAMM|nr:acyltransferase family protein [Ferrimonas sediminicola]TKB50324.1 acyltransferase [Ferrimonas sediminicola]
MSQTRPSIFYLDFLRCIAAIAVVLIHVLGPWRHLWGLAPMDQWMAATGYNALSRWAVPVFMMITGALLLSDNRPFVFKDYISRRLLKVVVPFIGWTLIYSIASGWTQTGFSQELFTETLTGSPREPAWYHLWFFYDFIPLYFVIPLLGPILAKLDRERIKLIICAWMLLTLMHWLHVDTPLRQNLILYSGYLILGWFLFNRDNNNEVKWWVLAGCLALMINVTGSWWFSELKRGYSAYFMGYKSLNTVVIAAMLFVVAQKYADRIQGPLRRGISLVARYSLGIYLIHPLLLIPVRDLTKGVYGWFGSNWVGLPVITLATLLCALLLTMLLAKIPLVKRLVP